MRFYIKAEHGEGHKTYTSHYTIEAETAQDAARQAFYRFSDRMEGIPGGQLKEEWRYEVFVPYDVAAEESYAP